MEIELSNPAEVKRAVMEVQAKLQTANERIKELEAKNEELEKQVGYGEGVIAQLRARLEVAAELDVEHARLRKVVEAREAENVRLRRALGEFKKS